MLIGTDRAEAVYQVVAARPEFAKLTQAERDQVRKQLRDILGSDTSYLTTNATVLPGGMQAPAGATVATPTGPGSVTSPVGILGQGRLT